MRDILEISELFVSFQGEGGSTGCPAVFLRLAGCNLSCPFCDEETEQIRAYDVELLKNIVLRAVEKLPKKNQLLVITGGEPLLQESPLKKLVKQLNKEKPTLKIHLETNGTILKFLPVDKYVISPKNIYEEDILETLDYFSRMPTETELKFLVTNENIDHIINIINRITFRCTKIYLQPEYNERQEIIQSIIKNYNRFNKKIKISSQTHKMYGVR